MSTRHTASLALFVAILLFVALPQPGVKAQYSQPSLSRQYANQWEGDRIRIRPVSVEPGARLAASPGGSDRVLIYLTGDLEGRMPKAEAIWQPAGAPEQENRGRVRVEALVVDLAPGPAAAPGATPVESLPIGGVDTQPLIDNPRVVVAKVRYSAYALAADPWHFHPQDGLVVYLSGGYAWSLGGWGYPARVRRGDFDVVPANTFHTIANAGSDPLEFLVIFPK